MSARNWMKLWTADWLTGTRRMSAAAKGVYIDLLCEAWRNGPLPTEVDELARLACMGEEEFRVLWDRWVSSKWVETPEGLVNPRQEEVRAEQEKRLDQGRERQRRYRERNASGNALHGASPDALCDVTGQRDSGLRTQDSGSRDTGKENARARDPLAHLEISGTPPWVIGLLREYQEHAVDDGVRARPIPTAKSAALLAQSVKASGEDDARDALRRCIEADGLTLANYLKAVSDDKRREKAKGRPDHKVRDDERRLSRYDREMDEKMKAQREWFVKNGYSPDGRELDETGAEQ